MRKSIWISSLLIVLCVSLTLAGVTHLNRSGEQIQFEETILSGDKSVLEGLSVTQHIYDQAGQGNLYWDTVYRPGVEPSAQTNFTYTEKPLEMQNPEEEYLSISLFTRMSTETSEIDLQKTGGKWSTILAKLAERAGSSSNYAAWVNLKDHFDYLPLQINVNIGDLNLQSLDSGTGASDSWTEQLRDAFRLPLPEKCTARVEIWKRNDGSVYHFTVSMDTPLPEMVTDSVITDEYCYLVVAGKMTDGRPLSTDDGQSLCGIYRIPYEEVEEKTAFGAIRRKTVLHVEDMVKTASVEPGMITSKVIYDEEKDQIEFIYFGETEENVRQIKLMVIDAESGEILQDIVVVEDLKGGSLQGVYSGKNALLIATLNGDGYFFTLVSNGDDGIHRKEFEFPCPKATEMVSHSSWMYPKYGMGVAFDGERLAIATVIGDNSDCQFGLAVYEAGELVYQGEYTSSLGIGSNVYSTMKPRESMAIEVSWE